MRTRAAMLWVVLAACHSRTNPYDSAPADVVATWREEKLPFASGKSFVVSQGAFGKNSHHEKGIEYRWDFDVPYGTAVLASEDGVVLSVNVPNRGGGCDPKYADAANTLEVRNADGTVAQYTHVDAKVAKGDVVKMGETIAVTSMNGDICAPQLDFLVFASEKTMYGSPNQQSIPLRFVGLPDGKASEGLRATTP